MKNLEKIAIDTLVKQFSDKYKTMIDDSISAKAAVEIAQDNFKKIAGPLAKASRESLNEVISEMSDEAVVYAEGLLNEVVHIPIKLKN